MDRSGSRGASIGLGHCRQQFAADNVATIKASKSATKDSYHWQGSAMVNLNLRGDDLPLMVIVLVFLLFLDAKKDYKISWSEGG